MVSKNSKADVVDSIDKLVQQIDPEVILAGMLGAIAAGGGITPPLTRILMSLGGSPGTSANADLVSAFGAAAASTWYDVAKWGSPLAFTIGLVSPSYSPDYVDGKKVTVEERKAQVYQRALMASGALEAMMMMSAMKNPAIIKAIGDTTSAFAGSLTPG